MKALDRLRDEVAALRRRFDTESTTLRLGTYQADGSVLQPDGAEVIPAAVLAYVESGDTVLVGHYLRRSWVLGKVSPDGPPEPPVVLPTPVVASLRTATTAGTTTSSTFSTPSSTTALDFVASDPCWVVVTVMARVHVGYSNGIGQWRISWSGATTGDSQSQLTSTDGGAVEVNFNSSAHASSDIFVTTITMTTTVLVAAGTTSFTIQQRLMSGSQAIGTYEAWATATPVGWADQYA